MPQIYTFTIIHLISLGVTHRVICNFLITNDLFAYNLGYKFIVLLVHLLYLVTKIAIDAFEVYKL